MFSLLLSFSLSIDSCSFSHEIKSQYPLKDLFVSLVLLILKLD